MEDIGVISSFPAMNISFNLVGGPLTILACTGTSPFSIA
jgi:hypothetical protein